MARNIRTKITMAKIWLNSIVFRENRETRRLL
jgi:hypothetical protein